MKKDTNLHQSIFSSRLMKKIIIVSHAFFPEQSPRSFRATELVKEFCRQGHSVTVMAPHREGMDTLFRDFPVKFRSLGRLNWRILNFQRLGLLGRIYNKAVNRLLPLLFEFPRMELFFRVRKALREEQERYDMLISVAVPYPIHWGVAAVWKKGGGELANLWVADCGDPYCLQENDTFRPPFYFRWVEKWFMRKANFITLPTDTSYLGYFPEFYDKIRVIPQGFRFEDIVKRETTNDGVVRFGYGGSFIPGRRDPKPFIEFLKRIPTIIRFEFHIYTSTPQFVPSYPQDDDRILIHQPVSRKELLETFSAFNFVVNFANVGAAQTPSKLIDYAIIDKPILQIDSGDASNEQRILDFFVGNYSDRFVVEGLEKYAIENICRAFLDLGNG